MNDNYMATEKEKINKAIELVHHLIELNGNIDLHLWIAALFGTIVNSYIICNFSYDEFLGSIDKACKHYKEWWGD